jgi:hypothetical protein
LNRCSLKESESYFVQKKNSAITKKNILCNNTIRYLGDWWYVTGSEDFSTLLMNQFNGKIHISHDGGDTWAEDVKLAAMR